jgi:polysaccharide chain length determinant protein (PEP-CTERM system associated)
MNPMSVQKEEPFDPRQYLRVINKRKILLILPFLGVVFTVMLGSLFIDPVYQASSTILVSEPKLLSQSVERMASQGSRERIDTLRREITSRDYLTRLIRTLGWHQDPVLRSQAERESEKYPDLTVDEIVERWLISALRRQIRVQGQGSDMLVIVVQDNDPKKAFLLAKTLTQVFIDETLRRELSGVRGALEFSNEQLAIYKAQLEASEEKLRRFREQMVRKSLQQDAGGREEMRRINALVTTAESDLREAGQRVTSLTIRFQNLTSANTNALSGGELEELKYEYHAAGRQFAELLTVYSWKDGRVIALSEQINEMRNDLRARLDAVCEEVIGNEDPVACGILVDLELARADEIFYRNKWRTLNDYVDQYERSMVGEPQDEMALERLKEEVESNRKLYQMFLDQSQGAQIQEAAHRTAAEGRFRLMEPAMLPLRPVKPNRLRLAGMSVVIGLLLGLMLVFLTEYLDHSLSSVEEIERYLGHAVLVTIPRMNLGVKRVRKTRVVVLVILSLLAAILIVIFVKQRFLGA